MRLIDADKLMDFISEHAEQIQYAIEHRDAEILEKIITEIPTAYDIYEVIAQFGEKIEKLDREEQNYYAKEDFKNAAELSKKLTTVYDDRIIVRKGIKKWNIK